MVASNGERRRKWVLLAYRLPREPSTPRINLWRKLRGVGAGQLLDGLVALPLDSRNKEQLEWLAEAVIEAGGEASIWTGRPVTAEQERTLVAAMTDAIAQEYRVLIEAAGAPQKHGTSTRRTLARLRRELGRVRARDYFPPPERRAAEAAVEALGKTVEVS
jgi:hypothetical protein